MKKTVVRVGFALLVPLAGIAQNIEKAALAKMATLNELISTAQKQGIDTQPEEMSIRTAEVFLKFADWDEAHIDKNTQYFSQVSCYKKQAAQLAQDLPGFERNDICRMLDESAAYLRRLIHGDAVRKPGPRVDWSGVTHEGDQLTYKNRPVFLADYTWKLNIPELTEFFGEQDGAYIAPTQVVNEDGDVNRNVVDGLKKQPDGTPGFVFIGNSHVPAWTREAYGPEFTAVKGAPFFNYDVDHPGTRKLMSNLLAATVPHMAGKNYTQLGYMLCNEPRWITYKDGKKKVYYNSGVSQYTIDKFKKWLKGRHGSIERLNGLWGTDFARFDEVALDIPIDISLIGTAQWYDWNSFNDARVLDWFTFMKAEIRKHDPAAKTHLKIMPSFFTDNDPCTGIDFEALTEMSDIIGNDCAAAYNNIRAKETPDWKAHYIFDWRELYMAYDFLKSVSPDQIIFNTESHLLSTGHARDLFMDPAYVRSVTWAAHTLGLNASQIWFWPRREDGSLRKNVSNGYAGSNNQQPRVTREVHATMMDLNAYSEEIMAMQRQRKPLRIFYSRTAAVQKREYMDQVFELYKSLNFEGVALGFATKNIIARHDHSTWDAILIYETERVTLAELSAVQSYLDHGGVVFIDSKSMKQNEYGAALPALKKSRGRFVEMDTLQEMKAAGLKLLAEKDRLPGVTISETNGNSVKGCTWKCVKNSDGNPVLSIINLGNTEAHLTIQPAGGIGGKGCLDLIHGIPVGFSPVLQPYEVLFVEIK